MSDKPNLEVKKEYSSLKKSKKKLLQEIQDMKNALKHKKDKP